MKSEDGGIYKLKYCYLRGNKESWVEDGSRVGSQLENMACLAAAFDRPYRLKVSHA